jgi:hypothetical protein
MVEPIVAVAKAEALTEVGERQAAAGLAERYL